MTRRKNTLPLDVDFLYEIGSMRFIQRTWRQFFRDEVANNAEHTFRVVWIALVIARQEKVKNEEKIIKLSLIHDISESRCLDTNYVSKIYSSRDEEKAIKDMLKDTSLAEEFIELFHECKEKKTIEAQIVKDADNLDVDFEIQEMMSKGHTMKKVWSRKNIRTMLFTKSAKKLWDELYAADPHRWHVTAHNKYKTAKTKLT
jgi:putative hydrolases of HD superfamily